MLNRVSVLGRSKLGQGRHFWEWAKHAWLYSDLFQALKGEQLSALGCQRINSVGETMSNYVHIITLICNYALLTLASRHSNVATNISPTAVAGVSFYPPSPLIYFSPKLTILYFSVYSCLKITVLYFSFNLFLSQNHSTVLLLKITVLYFSFNLFLSQNHSTVLLL